MPAKDPAVIVVNLYLALNVLFPTWLIKSSKCIFEKRKWFMF